MSDHAGQFRHTLKRDFPPATAHRGRSQRVDEVSGFLLQPLLRFSEGLEMLIESAIGGLAGQFEMAELLVIPLQRFR